MAEIIDGKQISAQIKEELKQEVAELSAQGRGIRQKPGNRLSIS